MGGYHLNRLSASYCAMLCLAACFVGSRNTKHDLGRREIMVPKFDIFTRLPDGQVLWIQSCDTLAEARERLVEVARNAPGDCFIYSEAKVVVELITQGQLTSKTDSPERRS